MSPPLQDVAPAVNAQQSIGNKLSLGEQITKAMRSENSQYALSYRDPTGEAAIRAEAERIREALGWRPRTVNKLVMGPEKLPIHISDELAERLFIFLAVEAEMKPTNSGKGLNASLKKKTPTAGTNANQNCSEGPNN